MWHLILIASISLSNQHHYTMSITNATPISSSNKESSESKDQRDKIHVKDIIQKLMKTKRNKKKFRVPKQEMSAPYDW